MTDVTAETQRIKKLEDKVDSEVVLNDTFKVLADSRKSSREPNQQLNQNMVFKPTLTEMQVRQARSHNVLIFSIPKTTKEDREERRTNQGCQRATPVQWKHCNKQFKALQTRQVIVIN